MEYYNSFFGDEETINEEDKYDTLNDAPRRQKISYLTCHSSSITPRIYDDNSLVRKGWNKPPRYHRSINRETIRQQF
jgi:hypothetical protein